jgi:hypothetical protein
VYKTPDFDEPDPGRSLVACGTVIGASVVVDVVEVVDVVVVVVSGAIVVAGGTGFFFGAVVVGAGASVVVVVVGIETASIDVRAADLSASGSAT